MILSCRAGSYTLVPTFNDAGELWLSPDATAARAELAASSHFDSPMGGAPHGGGTCGTSFNMMGSSGAPCGVTFDAAAGEARYVEFINTNNEGSGSVDILVEFVPPGGEEGLGTEG